MKNKFVIDILNEDAYAYRAHWDASDRAGSRQNQRNFDMKMKNDLQKNYELPDDLAERIWNYAWDEGHSSGHASVANIYDDIVTIIKG